MSHPYNNIVEGHKLISERNENSVRVYELQIKLKNSCKSDLDRITIKENLLSDSSSILKSLKISPDNSGLIPCDSRKVKEGFLVDPDNSVLRGNTEVTITYELMINKNESNGQQLPSVVIVGRRKHIHKISSIIIGSQEEVPVKIESNLKVEKLVGCNQLIPLNPSKQGGEVILDSFIKNQLPYKCKIFGLPGSSVFQWNKILQNAIDANRLEIIHITNETAGAYAAQNFSDSKEGQKKIGVVFTTRGPGITMAITGIASALREELPMIYLVGVSPTDRKDESQNVDLTILDKVSKKVFRITKEMLSTSEIEDVIDEACFIAINGTPQNPGRGPVSILVNLDVWRNPMSVATCNNFVPMLPLTGNESNALYDIVN